MRRQLSRVLINPQPENMSAVAITGAISRKPSPSSWLAHPQINHTGNPNDQRYGQDDTGAEQ
jgi:hypothetical protein